MEVVQPMSTEQGESEERRPRAHWLPFTHSFLICNVFVTFHVRYLVGKHKKCSKFKEKSGLCAVITRMPLVFFFVVCLVCRFKTKLAASLARCRIKHNLLSIECILPESVKKKQQRLSNLPLYAWVNTLKSRSAEHAESTRSPSQKQIARTYTFTPVHKHRRAL